MKRTLVAFILMLFTMTSVLLAQGTTPTVLTPSYTDQTTGLVFMTFPDGESELVSLLETNLDDGDTLYLEIYEIDFPALENVFQKLIQKGVTINIIYENFATPQGRESYIVKHEVGLQTNNSATNVYPINWFGGVVHTKSFFATDSSGNPKFAIIMSCNLINDPNPPVSQAWGGTRDFALYTDVTQYYLTLRRGSINYALLVL